MRQRWNLIPAFKLEVPHLLQSKFPSLRAALMLISKAAPRAKFAACGAAGGPTYIYVIIYFICVYIYIYACTDLL